MLFVRVVVCFALPALTAIAAVVQGVVLEQASGRPMSRTQIGLTPIPKGGNSGRPMVTRTGLAGEYTILGVPDGVYLVAAIRPHYFPASYGQRLPGGAGTPLEVKGDAKLFVELHLRRMGSITGKILDENGIGLPDVPVVAYRARLPMQVAASGVSDDRGVYRIHGLFPGKYWIRTGSHRMEDGTGVLPTFSPESLETRDSRTYAVAVDAETSDADVRPIPGNLFRLGGTVQCEPQYYPVMVRLTTETGSRTASSWCGGHYSFDGLAPAMYEVFAEMEGGKSSGFVELYLARNSQAGTLRCGPAPRVNLQFQGPEVTVIGWRKDLTEAGPEMEIKSQQPLPPGHWEMGAVTGADQFVERIWSDEGGSRTPQRAEQTGEWFDVFVQASYQNVWVSVASTAAHISGTVQTEKVAVEGIPVFLWPVAEAARKSLHGPLHVLTDVSGQFQFDGLPPGDYRLTASYDLTEVDEEAMESAEATVVHLDVSQKKNVELKPWLAAY